MVKASNRIASNLLVLLTILLSGLGCSFDPYKLLPKQLITEPTLDRVPPAVGGRKISQSSSASVVWQKGDIVIPRRGTTLLSGLIAGRGNVAFVNFLGGTLNQINRFDVLNAETGSTIWESERFPDYEAVAIGEDKAIVLLNEGSPLNIYNIHGNSEPISSINHFQEATEFYLYPAVAEENIYIYYQRGDKYFVHSMNLESLEITQSRVIQVSGRPHLFLFQNQFSLRIGEGQYVGADLETGKELWRVRLPAGEWRISNWPVLQDDMVIISAGDGVRYSLTAIDIETGNPLWETDKVFGPSVVIHQESVFALRNDATLVKLDLDTGQVEEEFPFEPASTNPGKWTYLLASDGERLFIYFGDSQELLALRTP